MNYARRSGWRFERTELCARGSGPSYLASSRVCLATLVRKLPRRQTFVSVTQSFNTTTSMGRLTLNILLSFARFAREVTAEHIRDRVAASRRKGIWMRESGEFATIAELAKRVGIASSCLTRVLRLILLVPDIVDAMLEATQGSEVTLARVLEPFPQGWAGQRD